MCPSPIIRLAVLLSILAGTGGVPKKPVLGDCGGGFTMNVKNPSLTIGTQASGQYAANQKCLWTIAGTHTCTPKILCSLVDLRADCEKEHLKISDGVGGEVKLCGSAPFSAPKRASGGGRDLYITLQTSASTAFNKLYKGVKCDLSCANDKSPGELLPPDGVVPKEDATCVCGIPGNKDHRIVGGEDAEEREFPWIAALVKTTTRVPSCGASIINSKYVLTAAHCFFFKKKIKLDEYEVLTHAYVLEQKLQKGADYKAEFGVKGSIKAPGWDRKKTTDKSEHSLRFQIEEIIMHPLMSDQYDYDVALIRVKGTIPVVTNDEVTPICLPGIGLYNNTFNGQKAVVAGWGLPYYEAGTSTRLLQKLTMPVVPTSECSRMLPPTISVSPRQLCAGFQQGGKDSCKGDSGGPLSLMLNKYQYTEIGIVSFGFKCALPNRPGLYSRMTELVQWVSFHTRNTDSTWCKKTMT